MGHIAENASKQISEAFGRRLKDTGITRVQWIAIYYIHRHEGIAQKELAEKMHVAESSVGRLVDRLERDGYVERVRSEEDRRVVTLELLPEGKKLIEKLLPIGVTFNDDLVRGINEEDLIVYERVLGQMLENIAESEDQSGMDR